jgi:curved DNA-binding protein CbpA
LSGDLTPNLYRILGLRPDADIAKIRAAYRKLAKRFHPDVNATDAGAEQRIKAINRAYQVLGAPEARTAYDRDLERLRADARGRFWKGVVAGVATFVLTLV